MQNNKTLHTLGLRLVKSLGLDEGRKATENKAIKDEAKAAGIAPNEVTVYVQHHYDTLLEEISGNGTLSSFTETWKAANPSKPLNGPEFLADLTNAAKQHPHFNFSA